MTETPHSDKTSQTNGVSERLRRSRRRERALELAWYTGIAVLSVLIIASSAVVVAASRPETCQRCHSDVAESVSHSAHSSVPCESCHSGPTALGVLEGRLAVVNMVVATAIPSALPPQGNVPSQRCVSCHEGQLSEPVVVGGLKMDHTAPLEAGWECRSCHAARIHLRTVAGGSYTMDMCLGCHTANPVNLATCEICHVESPGSSQRRADSPWAITHGPNWQSTHGMGDQATCTGCHADSFCSRCHGANVPHPAKYLSTHGKDVLSREDGSEACSRCHREGSCLQCHGTPMPHPDGFLAGHSKEIEKRGDEFKETCLRCHKQESCDNCHQRHQHPGLTQERIDALMSNPVNRR